MFGQHDKKLPNYRRAEVSSHRTVDTGIWVTWRHGVYDVTDYVDGHPGGQTINWGLGRSMEPFFEKFAIHNEPHVLEILESMRVGNVHPDEMTPEALTKHFHNPMPEHVDLNQYRLEVSRRGVKSYLPFLFSSTYSVDVLRSNFTSHLVKQPPRPGGNATR